VISWSLFEELFLTILINCWKKNPVVECDLAHLVTLELMIAFTTIMYIAETIIYEVHKKSMKIYQINNKI